MTPAQIDHMPAGAEMDELVEIHIYQSILLADGEIDIFKATAAMSHGQTFKEKIRLFKIPLSEPDYQTGLMFRLSWPRSWSHDGFGTSARELVNKMREDGWLFSLYEVPGSGVETLRIAAFEKLPQANMKGCQGRAEGNTDALAIARAALKATLQDEVLNKRGDVRVISPQHPFKGCLDRPCETCGLPDRAWIHSGERPVLYERGEK